MRTTFLDPFNAKTMTAYEVANTFVSSSKFAQLVGPWNSLLIGPRGSGKTTLMRMLSVDALRAWSSPLADGFRNDISFTGIYVPSDIAWSEMVKALSSTLEDPITAHISAAAFVTNVLQSVILTMQSRLYPGAENLPAPRFRLVSCEHSRLEQAIKDIAALWRLKLRSLSLDGIITALGERQIDIKRQANILSTLSIDEASNLVQRIEYLGLPLVESVSQALSTFDRAVEDEQSAWALLLDEFEVAPVNLQQEVLAALRASATTTRLLFKVALAPCGVHTLIDLSDSLRPTHGNDYKQVELWYVNKDDAAEFCNQLFESRKTRWPTALKDLTPTQVFGESGYAIVDEEGESTSPTGELKSAILSQQFMELAAKDGSFDAFLNQKGINPVLLNTSPDAPNGNTIRKIAPIVAFRNAYRSKVEGKRRGRKPYNSTYAGWSAICALSEGNPRWLIGILNEIISKVDSDTRLPVPFSKQQAQLAGLSQAFTEILRSAATAQQPGQATSVDVFEVLQIIGDYFHAKLVKDDFVEDPPLSFVVDDAVSSSIENALRLAMNHGALVCYEVPDSLGGYSSLRGKRFRLAYLLAPVFKLPLRKSKAVNLSRIVAGTDLVREDASGTSAMRATRRSPIPAATTPTQGELPW